MKNLISISGLLLLSAMFFGCNQKSDTNNVVQTPVCGVGQYYSNGSCYTGNGYAGPSNYSYNTSFYADNYSGTSRISVVNAQKMKDLFKFGMGVCDRAYGNLGQANCDSYLAGRMAIVIQFPTGASAGSNSILATIFAEPQINPNFNYQVQYPSGWGLLGAALGYVTGVYVPDPQYYTGARRSPLQLQMVVSAINNSAGFEARGYGDYWTGYNTTLLAVQVPQGKVESSSFNFNFLVQGTTAAQGVMSRCQNLNCGL